MAAMLSVCFLFLVMHGVGSYSLTECNADGSFEMVENQPAAITSTGLRGYHAIYWSIRGSVTGDVETRVGDCESCYSSPCPGKCSGVNQNFTITRTRKTSTLTFRRGLNFGDTAVVKCSKINNDTEKSCKANVIKAYSLPGCKNNSLEVVDEGQTIILCTNIIRSHSIDWTITYPGRSARTIATCPPCSTNGTCLECKVGYNGYRVQRTPENSTLQLTGGKDKAKEGATLECSRTDNRTYAGCQVHVLNYRLPQCQNGHLDVSEVSPWTWIQCEDLRVSHDIKWTITDNFGDSLTVATCDSGGICKPQDGFESSRVNDSMSELRVVERVRETANHTVTCQRQDGAAGVSCRLRTVSPAVLLVPTVNVDGDFTVSGRVEISKVFASDNNITCRWFYRNGNSTNIIASVNLSLSGFSDGGVSYQRGVCVMETQVNTTQTSYIFTVDIQPGTGHVFAGTIDIRKPGNLTLEGSTCPEYVAEGEDLMCKCGYHPSQQGSPGAFVHWQNTTGTHVLSVLSVSRQNSGEDYVCTSLWASGTADEVQSSVNYTLMVAYGPHAANVTHGDLTDVTKGLTRSALTCTYDEAFPSADFTWNVHCTKLSFTPSTSTCVFDPGLVKDVDDVICTVSNTEIRQFSVTASYRLRLPSSKSEAVPLAAVAGGVVAAAVLVIVVVVVVVFIRRKRKETPHQQRFPTETSQNGSSLNNTSHGHTDISKNKTEAAVSASPAEMSVVSAAVSVAADNPEDHVYAQVDKTRKKKPPGTPDKAEKLNSTDTSETHDDKPRHVKPMEASKETPLRGKDVNKAQVIQGAEKAASTGGERSTMEPTEEVGMQGQLKGDNQQSLVDRKEDSEENRASVRAEFKEDNLVDDVYVNDDVLSPLAGNTGVQIKPTPKNSGYTNVQPAENEPPGNTSDTGYTNTQHTTENAAKSSPSDNVYANVESEKHHTEKEANDADDVTGAKFTSQDDVKTRHSNDVYNNVPPASSEGGEGGMTKAAETDEEYHSLHLIRQQQMADPTYHHLTEV